MIIGIPKGDLQERALRALQIELSTNDQRQICFEYGGHTVLLIKNKDALPLVERGRLDVAVTCTAYHEEWVGFDRSLSKTVSIVELADSKPWSVSLIGSSSEAREEVFTEFPYITNSALPYTGRRRVVRVTGSVEAYVKAYDAWGVTIVSSGKTLAANGLKVIEKLTAVRPCLAFSSRNDEAKEMVRSLGYL